MTFMSIFTSFTITSIDEIYYQLNFYDILVS